MNHDIHFAPRRRGLGNSPSLAPHRILERNWHPVAAANDDDGPQRDPALGGLRGLFIMYAVAVLIGVLLATGGVL